MPITIEKAVTVCDVITLDRAVHKNMVSVVYFVQRIYPVESDAESEKLRKLVYSLEQSARSKCYMVIDESNRRSCRLAAWARRCVGTWWVHKTVPFMTFNLPLSQQLGTQGKVHECTN
jgi:hypothetical protein